MSKTKSTSIDIEKKLEKLIKQNALLQKSYHENIENNTLEAVSLLKNLINSTPEIEAIKWAQYTPYFNDGDPCEFSVYDLEIKFNKDLLPLNEETAYSGDKYADGEGFIPEWRIESFFEELEDVLNFKQIASIEKKINLFKEMHSSLRNMEGSLKIAFGDHTNVIVTKKGIETSELDHD